MQRQRPRSANDPGRAKPQTSLSWLLLVRKYRSGHIGGTTKQAVGFVNENHVGVGEFEIRAIDDSAEEVRHPVPRGIKVPVVERILDVVEIAREGVNGLSAAIEQGNFGDYRGLGDGIYELRSTFGPGYRVYFGQDDNTIVVLLNGGDKSSQSQDIERAKAYWKEYQDNAAI